MKDGHLTNFKVRIKTIMRVFFAYLIRKDEKYWFYDCMETTVIVLMEVKISTIFWSNLEIIYFAIQQVGIIQIWKEHKNIMFKDN